MEPTATAQARKLNVLVFAARKLLDKAKGTSFNLFCEVSLLDVDGKPIGLNKKTNVIKTQKYTTDGYNWNQTLQFDVTPNWAGIKVSCWDKHKIRKNKFLGQIIIKFNTALLQGEEGLDDWFPVSHRAKNEPVEGEIHLKIQYGDLKQTKSSSSSGGASPASTRRDSVDSGTGSNGSRGSSPTRSSSEGKKNPKTITIVDLNSHDKNKNNNNNSSSTTTVSNNDKGKGKLPSDLRVSNHWNEHDSALKLSSHVIVEPDDVDDDQQDDDDGDDDDGDDDNNTPQEESEDEDDAMYDDQEDWGLDEDLDDYAKPAEQKPKVLTTSGIINAREQVIDRVSEILKLPPHITQALLKYYSWDEEKLLTKYMDNPEAVHKDSGVELPDKPLSASQQPQLTEIVCPVCYDDEVSDITALSCHHYFCNACWKQHLTVAIKEGNAYGVKCMAPKCNQLVPDYIVRKIVEPEIYKKYAYFLSQTFVDTNPNVKWCPFPGCDCAVDKAQTIEEGRNIVAKCGGCNHKFCFLCLQEAHTPVNCDQLKEWKKKCEDDSETYNWIASNTKDCPNTSCGVAIEKNDGCFMMTCYKCRFQFCWLCSGDWKTHGDHFSCSKFKDAKLQNKPEWRDATDDKLAKRSALDRYLHYYNLYVNHDNSLKFESKTREKIEETMKKLQDEGSSFIDVQFMEEAMNQLNECRRTLKWTYVWSFFQTDPVKKDLFEFFQGDLEMIAEKLGAKLLSPVEKINKEDLKSITRVARNTLNHLLKDANL